MIDEVTLVEIVATYERHGWILRRILLSPATRIKLGQAWSGKFEGVAILDSAFDAAWFSRPPRKGGIAWELRNLGNVPFALVENMDEDEVDFEEMLRGVESRLRDAVAAKQSA